MAILPQIENPITTPEELNPVMLPSKTYKISDRIATTFSKISAPSGSNEGIDSISIYDAMDYDASLDVKGNTEQVQLEGKNLFDCYSYPQSRTYNGITCTNNGDGSFTLNGTCTADNTSFSLGSVSFIRDLVNNGGVTQTAYYISGNCTKGPSSSARTVIRLNYDTGTSLMIPLQDLKEQLVISRTHPKDSRTSSWSWVLVLGNGDVFDNFTIKYQLEKGWSATDYELYCGGQPSPNPEYPQDIKVVTGDNRIKHIGKNLLNTNNINTIIRNGLTFTPVYKNNELQYIEVNGTANSTTTADYGIAKYTLGTYIISGCPKNGSNDSYKVVFLDATTYMYNVDDFGNGVLQTITDAVATHSFLYRIRIANGYTCNNLRFYPMVREATIADNNYEPYSEEEYKLDLWKENEFDSNNATIVNALLNDAGVLRANNYYRTIIISSLPYTAYKISKKIGNFFRVAEFDSFPQLEDSYNNRIKDDNAEYIIYKTSSSTNYLAITYWANTDIVEETEMLNSIQIQESIELCKIGDYQDYLYKENGNWYKYEAIKKIVLDGSESWSRGNPTHRYFTNISGQAKINILPISNSFIGYVDNIPSNVNGLLLQHPDTSTIRINLYNLNYADNLDGFKIWLSSNNVTLYYVLVTPTTTQITDPTLISQLEALNTIKCFYKTNYFVAENNNLPIYLHILYYTQNDVKLESVASTRIAGFVDNLEAVKQAIYHILMIERYSYDIYSSNYGVELNQYIGKGIDYLQASIEKTLQEALLMDLRIISVTVTDIEKLTNDTALVKFDVLSIYGNLQMEVNVNV